jgi:hypothetical protein
MLPCWATGDCSIIPETDDISKLWLDIRNNAVNPAVQKAFAATFSEAYISAFNAVLARNPQWEYLTEEQKRMLRPHVGNLVDSARIHYESVLPDNITVLRKGIKIMEGSLAQTYCSDIFVAGPNRGGSQGHLKLLHHELIHYDQCVRKGGLSQFGFDYGLGFIKSNFEYYNNVMEVEAYRKAGSASYQVAFVQSDSNLSSGFFRQNDRPEVYFVNAGSRTSCHVQNPSQMEVYGGFRQVRVVSGDTFRVGAQFNGPCLWPDGLYRSSDRPEVYYLHNNWKSACWVRTPQRVEELGGWGRVRLVNQTPRESFIVGRSYSESC